MHFLKESLNVKAVKQNSNDFSPDLFFVPIY